jgi:outer membrane protein
MSNKHLTGATRALLLGLLAALAPLGAGAGNAAGLPPSPASPLLAPGRRGDPCVFGAPGDPLTLNEAVSRALCANPKTRAAWANIELYVAEVHRARQSYLPDLGASARENESVTHTTITHDPALNTNARAHYPEGRVSLDWVLYDFGQRADRLDSARALLAAAHANLDATLQRVFLRAAADYYDTESAQASVAAAVEIERLSRRSLEVARARVRRGVAPVSDQLQAATAHEQALLARVKAQSEFTAARGALAFDMGLDPESAIRVPSAPLSAGAPPQFSGSLSELMRQAKRNHPSIALARSELAAARADERAARARGYPSVRLTGEIARSDQPLTPSLGSPSVPGSVRDRSIGIELDLPISQLLWKRGRIDEARARVEMQKEALYGAREQVAANVWNSYTALRADTENLPVSRSLLESARAALEAAQRRYEGGAGSILELLSAQRAYARAKEERIQALSDWRIARLALAASLGRLGTWALGGAGQMP